MTLIGTQGLAEVFSRYLKFCVIGGTGVAVDMSLLYVFSDAEMLGWNLTLSKALSAESAVVNNFFWNERYTFKDRIYLGTVGWARWRRLTRFNLVCALGMALSILLLHLQVKVLELNVYASNFIAIVIVSVLNFTLSYFYGWRMDPASVRRQPGSD